MGEVLPLNHSGLLHNNKYWLITAYDREVPVGIRLLTDPKWYIKSMCITN